MRLPSDHSPPPSIPIPFWDVPLSSAVVLDGEGNAKLGDTVSAVFLALAPEELDCDGASNNQITTQWSRPAVLGPEVTRQSVGVATADGKSTFPVAITTHVDGGVLHVVLAEDPVPRLVLHNDCPFTLQFGQTIPALSPFHGRASQEKLVVMEQADALGYVPDVAAHSSVHYELPIMREWFSTSSDVQKLPEVHVQALYNVNLKEIPEKNEEEIEASTEVPQGWSKAFDINTVQETSLPLPGRGQVLVSVLRERLCTHVRIRPFDENTHDVDTPPQQLRHSQPSFKVELFILQFGVTITDEVSNVKCPFEVLRMTAQDVVVKHSACGWRTGSNCPEFFVGVGSIQVDSQLQDDLYEYAVIMLPTAPAASPNSSPRKSSARSRTKPLVCIKGAYEPASLVSGTFLHSLLIAVQPLTVYLEDKFLYRIAAVMASFKPPAVTGEEPLCQTNQVGAILEASLSNISPLVIGWFKVEPLILNVTLHGSAKLFLAVEDTPLTLSQFEMSPVFLQSSVLVQKLSYHYVTSALFKAGWVLGSLELLGNPASLVRNFSQGLADFFYLPYDGLTRGPGAFVRGMSKGTSSLVRHFSAGALTSVTSLASSVARNLDRLGMDQEYSMLQEEQRCRRPTRVLTGEVFALYLLPEGNIVRKRFVE